MVLCSLSTLKKCTFFVTSKFFSSLEELSSSDGSGCGPVPWPKRQVLLVAQPEAQKWAENGGRQMPAAQKMPALPIPSLVSSKIHRQFREEELFKKLLMTMSIIYILGTYLVLSILQIFFKEAQNLFKKKKFSTIHFRNKIKQILPFLWVSLGEIFVCIQNFHEKSYPAPISLHTYLNIVSKWYNCARIIWRWNRYPKYGLRVPGIRQKNGLKASWTRLFSSSYAKFLPYSIISISNMEKDWQKGEKNGCSACLQHIFLTDSRNPKTNILVTYSDI